MLRSIFFAAIVAANLGAAQAGQIFDLNFGGGIPAALTSTADGTAVIAGDPLGVFGDVGTFLDASNGEIQLFSSFFEVDTDLDFVLFVEALPISGGMGFVGLRPEGAPDDFFIPLIGTAGVSLLFTLPDDVWTGVHTTVPDSLFFGATHWQFVMGGDEKFFVNHVILDAVDNSGGGAGGSTPEPSSMMLLVSGAAFLFAAFGRRRRRA